ncbi:hypothetical protein [Porphyromonas phage phage007a_Bg4]|uniref:Uncharacterized protein n=6 Tax=Viruses TaxID=10239 RepID=A0AAT9JB60_9CAUD
MEIVRYSTKNSQFDRMESTSSKRRRCTSLQ